MSNNKVCQWGLSPIGLRHMLTIVKKSRLMGAEVPKHRTEQHLVPCVLDTSHIADDIVQVTSPQLSEMLLNFILHQKTVVLLGTVILESSCHARYVIRLGFCECLQVNCGADFSVLTTKAGEVYAWGKNMDGQLGCGNKQNHEVRHIG